MCQVAPTAAAVPNLPLVDFDLETVVSPGQAALPDLYRGHDVFLFTSRWVWGEQLAAPAWLLSSWVHGHEAWAKAQIRAMVGCLAACTSSQLRGCQ